MFRWAVSEELIDESVYRRLKSVTGLRRGKTEARESTPVPPVEDAVVNATLGHLPPVVSDMVQLGRLTGARPGEIVILRPVDIQKSKDVWVYRPESHKTEHLDKSRDIVIGPRAQQLLEPYLDRQANEFCFKPSEAVEAYRSQRHADRRVPLSCGTTRGDRARQRGRRATKQAPLGERYTVDSFRRAIHRACDRAFPPPEPLAQRDGETQRARDERLTKAQREQLKAWQSEHRWSPNQLRHSAATEIRQHFGIEAVAAVLGHSRTDTSEIYALRNLELAQRVAKELG